MWHRCCQQYAWNKPFKEKKVKTVLHGFIGIVKESKRKPNKLWVDEGREFLATLCKNG